MMNEVEGLYRARVSLKTLLCGKCMLGRSISDGRWERESFDEGAKLSDALFDYG